VMRAVATSSVESLDGVRLPMLPVVCYVQVSG
jgi:hypothetical protein